METERGRPIVEIEGYLMALEKTNGTRQYWRCKYWHNTTPPCTARANSAVNSDVFRQTKPHNHAPHAASPLKTRLLTAARKEAARRPAVPTNQLLDAVLNEVPEEEREAFPSHDAIRQRIYRARKRAEASSSDARRPRVRRCKKMLQDALAEQLRKRQVESDFDSEEETAGPSVDDHIPFSADPAKKSAAERSLKEQERLHERRDQKLAASANANQPVSMLTADSSDPNAGNDRLSARNTTRQLSFGDDVPSSDNWEVLYAATRDNVPGGEGNRDQQQAQQFDERDLSDRLSVSISGSASTRWSLIRDSPIPTRTPVRQALTAAANQKTSVNSSCRN